MHKYNSKHKQTNIHTYKQTNQHKNEHNNHYKAEALEIQERRQWKKKEGNEREAERRIEQKSLKKKQKMIS